MKISEKWLRSWVNPALNIEEIGEQLTMAGLEIDDIAPLARPFCTVVVGQVLSVQPHPDADKLKIAQVEVGVHAPQPLQIVCGAPNVRAGIKVPVALIGAKLPPLAEQDTPFIIKKSKLRGVESQGMLCGGSEIDYDDGVDGLLILPDDAPIGDDVRQYLGLDDCVLDIAITPNRGDCFSVRGIAREVAVINQLPFVSPFTAQKLAYDNQVIQNIQVLTELCPRYLAQTAVIEGSTQSPLWMQAFLKSAGITARNLIVDVTNFVLMELGQPLHAFDLDKVVGDIVVRLAVAGESVQLLNEQTVTLSGDELVIADDQGVIALAGIMGGLRTAVTSSTKRIVLESAFFAPLALAGRARRFGLHTDASQRFERGVDYQLPQLALNRAMELLKQYGNAQIGQQSTHNNADHLPKRPPVTLPIAKVKKRLGIDIAIDEIVAILSRLEMQVKVFDDVLIATPPSHRYDIEIAEDLIEEIARIYGYDRICGTLPDLCVQMNDPKDEQTITRLKNILVHAGYFEAVSFSFCDAKIEQWLDDATLSAPLALANPISSDLAVMRRSLLSSLLPCVLYNLKRQSHNVRLFEVGLRFLGQTPDSVAQLPTLTMVAVGARSEENWANDHAAMDFYDLKADVENLLPDWAQAQIHYQQATCAYFHPGQSADLYVGQTKLGTFGQLHPQVARALELPKTWAAELDIAALLTCYQKQPIHAPSKFPQVRRDFAFLVDEAILWQDMQRIIVEKAGAFLQKTWLFDVYAGEKLPKGKKSLAFACVWQDNNGTLDDLWVKTVSDVLIESLTQQLGAQIRDK